MSSDHAAIENSEPFDERRDGADRSTSTLSTKQTEELDRRRAQLRRDGSPARVD